MFMLREKPHYRVSVVAFLELLIMLRPSPPKQWKVKWSFVVHKTFLERHRKTALQHSPKLLK